MTPIGVLMLISAFVCLNLGFLVRRIDRKAALNRVFLLLCISFAIWGFTYSFAISAPDKDTVWFWFKLSSLGRCTFGGIFFHYLLILTHRDHWARKWWVLGLLYVPGLILIYQSFTGIVTASDFVRYSLGWYEVQEAVSPWYYLHIINFSVCVLVGFFLIVKWARTTTEHRERRQASIIVWTGIVTFILAVTTNIIMPALKIAELPAMAPVLVLIWITGIWYAMANYGLMTLNSDIAIQEASRRIMDLLITTNASGEITSVNQRVLDLLGYGRKELLGAPISKIVIEEDIVEQPLQALQQNQGFSEEKDLDYRTRQGDHIPVHVTASMIQNRWGIAQGMVIVAQDIRQARQLQKVSAATRDLLNNAGQGFLSFDHGFIVKDGFSSECQNIFQVDILNRNIAELLFPDDVEQQNFLKNLCKRILSTHDEDGRELYFPLLPEETEINDRNIRLEYRIISNRHEDPPEVFMMILTDITEQRKLEQLMEDEKNILKMVVGVVANRRVFNDCLMNYRQFFGEELEELLNLDPEEYVGVGILIMRTVHTFKGNFSQFSMGRLVARLHGLESLLSEIVWEINDYSARDRIRQIILEQNAAVWLEEEIQMLASILGEQFLSRDNRIIIDKTRLLNLEGKIMSTMSPKDCSFLLPELRRLRYSSFKELLTGYIEYVYQLAEKADKLIKALTIVGDDVFVDPDQYREFVRTLVHVFRNSIFHGIEDPEDRRQVGKEEYGSISCRVSCEGPNMLLKISDDGRGINLEDLRERAVLEGIYSKDTISEAGEADLLNLLFRDHFTTAEGITDYAGRGVGLAAVHHALSKLGGSVKVYTEQDRGTVFEFLIPVEDNQCMPCFSIDDLVMPLFNSASRYISEQLNGEVPSNFRIFNQERLTLESIASFIDIKGILRAKFVLSTNETIGRMLTEALNLGELTDADVAEYIEDTLAETANIILGNSIANFPAIENNIIIGPPVTICSDQDIMAFARSQIWGCSIQYSFGEVVIALLVSELPVVELNIGGM